jgi:small redox-active disulfide protein 2
MNVKVLGPGCANCEATVALIERVARAKGLDVTVEKVEELRDIMKYGVMATPGIVVDGVVVHAGGRPTRSEIERLLGG